VDDVVEGVLRALVRPNGCQVYNLGNGTPVSLNNFIRVVERACGKEGKLKV
jgi:UDP-glucuronate 4-epimerase